MVRAKTAKTSLAWFSSVLVPILMWAAVPNAAWADVSESGTINPTTNPTTWTSTTNVGIDGTVTVTPPTQIYSFGVTVGTAANKSGSTLIINGFDAVGPALAPTARA